MPGDVTALHGTGASCQSGGWKYLEKHLLSCRVCEMIKRREQREKESGLQQALLKAALAECLWQLWRQLLPKGALMFGCSGFPLARFPKLWVAAAEHQKSIGKRLVSASGKLEHGAPLRCCICPSTAEMLC